MKQYSKAEALLEVVVPKLVRQRGEADGGNQVAMGVLLLCLEALGRAPDFLAAYAPATQAAARQKAAGLKALEK